VNSRNSIGGQASVPAMEPWSREYRRHGRKRAGYTSIQPNHAKWCGSWAKSDTLKADASANHSATLRPSLSLMLWVSVLRPRAGRISAMFVYPKTRSAPTGPNNIAPHRCRVRLGVKVQGCRRVFHPRAGYLSARIARDDCWRLVMFGFQSSVMSVAINGGPTLRQRPLARSEIVCS
jgi:hypothetical protein